MDDMFQGAPKQNGRVLRAEAASEGCDYYSLSKQMRDACNKFEEKRGIAKPVWENRPFGRGQFKKT